MTPEERKQLKAAIHEIVVKLGKGENIEADVRHLREQFGITGSLENLLSSLDDHSDSSED